MNDNIFVQVCTVPKGLSGSRLAQTQEELQETQDNGVETKLTFCVTHSSNTTILTCWTNCCI